METQNEEEKPGPEMPPAPERERDPKISFPRKILIGIFILGFWIFYYWFREP